MDYSLLVGVHHCRTDECRDHPPAEAWGDAKVLTADLLAQGVAEAPDSPAPPPAGAHGRVFFFGIVDTLQAYNFVKQVEHLAKSRLLCIPPADISAIPADAYATRFINYLRDSVLE